MLSKKTFIATILSLLSFIIFAAFSVFDGGDTIPKGWLKAGNKANSYEVGIVHKAGKNGENAVYIKSIDSSINGFGTLMQSFLASHYKGERLKLSGYVKSKDAQSAGLWMRVDGQEKNEMLAFDNMQNRPIKGTTGWKSYQVVLDIPLDAFTINFGFLLTGTGEIWVSGLKLEKVDKSVPTTDLMPFHREVKAVNLDFAQ